MGIKKTKNGWRVTAVVRKAGKIIKRQQTIKSSASQAKELWYRLKQDIRAEPDPSTRCSLTTFGDAIQFYLDRKDPGRCKCLLDKLKDNLGRVPLAELDDRFERYLEILKTEKTIRGLPPKPATLNNFIVYAKAVCNMAQRYGHIDKNPIGHIPKYTANNARDRVLAEPEKMKLFNALKEKAPHLLPAVNFALQIPIRKNELVNMRKEDVDLFQNVIYLREGQTKNGSGAILPIPPDMLEYFQNIPSKSTHAFYRKIKGSRKDRTGKNERYVPLGDFKNSWKEVCKHAKIKDFRFHDTRHYACWQMAKRGIPETVIMRIGNWKTRAVFRRYRHISMDEILAAVRWDNGNCIHGVYTGTGTDGKE